MARQAEKRRERLDRINRIYRITRGSLKVPRRATKCLVQARLVHPFLAPHGLTAHQRCHVRSANHLSEYTEKAISRRDAEVAKKADTDFHRHTQIGFPFFESKESVLICVQILSARASSELRRAGVR